MLLYSCYMTTTVERADAMPLLQRMRAKRLLPPPARRRAIRDNAGLSREDIARELRARGFAVTKKAVEWWERPKGEGGVDPRPAKAIAYSRLLEQIEAETVDPAARPERVQLAARVERPQK
jgi:transcriptional regulator with XRE-family HTH domain